MMDTCRVPLDAGIIGSLEPVVEANWAETGGYADLELNVDWETYRQLDQLGIFYAFVVYDELDIIGYSFYIRAPSHPHDTTKQFAVQDTFYILPEHRSKGAALNLMAYIETYLLNEGVDVITQAAKPGTGFNKVLQQRGYEHTENMYLKRLR